jgi:glycosyltransferase involved in cell wall biosynthesis
MPGRAETATLQDGVAVVIPAYQAAATIADVVQRARRAALGAVVYVVDDGSTDATAEQGRGSGAQVLVHGQNQGKGAALRTGMDRALADGAEIVVTLDADGQHLPEEIPRLVGPIARREADLVLGARARAGAMPWARRCTNWVAAALASRVGGVAVPDAQTGYRALARAVAEMIRPRERGYDFETAFLLAALAGGVRVRSVPVATIYEGRPSHFRLWGDTWRLAGVFTRYSRPIIFGAR